MSKISAMILASPLSGEESIEVLQDGVNRRLMIDKILDSAKSAFEQAQFAGFEGTEEEWLASLIGPRGPQGIQGIPGTGTVRTFPFTESLVWTVQHNENSLTFIETLFDSNHRRIYANVKIIDVNSFAVEFTSPQAGSVRAIFI
jgi:hypothetical protein